MKISLKILCCVFLAHWADLGFSHEYFLSHGGFFHPKYPKDFTHFSYASSNAAKGGAITLTARESTFDSFNPYILRGTAPEGIGLLHATLMQTALDDPNVSYPYLAESVYIAPDHKAVVFKLRKDAQFHDGSSITSKDVVFTIDLLKKYGAPAYAIPLENIQSVTRVDRHTVRFAFKTPSKTLPFVLGKFPVLSKDFYRSGSFQSPSLIPPLGSGPYEIDAFRPGEFISYKRVREWWGRSLSIAQGHYNFDKVTYRYFKTKNAAVPALETNVVDHHWEWSISRWLHDYNFSAIQKGEVIKKDIKKPYPHGLNAFFLNTRKSFLRDRRVRKALNLLFNFEWLNHNLYFDHYKRNHSIYMDTGFGAEGLPSQREKALLSDYNKNLYAPEVLALPFEAPINAPTGVLRIHFEEALNLFQSAGWAIQDGVLTHPHFGPFKLHFLFSSPVYEKQYQEYFSTLRRFGIEVQVQSVDITTFQEKVKRFDYDVVLYFTPSFHVPGLEQEGLWSSKMADRPGSLNLAGVKNSLVDDLVQKIIHAEALEDLHLYTSLLDRIISWGYYIIPMWVPPLIHVAYWNKFSFLPMAENILYPHTWWMKKG